jgi:undecaprenyl diphosphate synthase
MLWRAAYSEFMFIDKNWPDMTPADIDTIISEYTNRNRRFGGN